MDNNQFQHITNPRFTIGSFISILLLWLGGLIYLFVVGSDKITGYLAVTPLLGVPIFIALTVAVLKEKGSNPVIKFISRIILFLVGLFFATAAITFSYILYIRFDSADFFITLFIFFILLILMKLSWVYFKRAVTGKVNVE